MMQTNNTTIKNSHTITLWHVLRSIALLLAVCSLHTNVEAQTSASFTAVQMVNSNTGFAVGTGGTIVTTGNGGSNWTTQTSGTSYTLGSVFFTDASTGWTVGSNALYGNNVILKTTNGGGSWMGQSSGQSVATLNGVSAANGSVAVVVGKSQYAQGLILRTTNGGSTWSAMPGAGANPLYGVCFIDANTVVAVGWAGVVLKSVDGGATWSQKFSSATDIFMQVRFSGSTGFIVGTTGTVFKSVNSGDSWTEQRRTATSTPDLYSISFGDASTAYISGGSGTILKSGDGGSTWGGQASGSPYALQGVSFVSQSTGVVVGGNGTILRTTNGGSSYSQATIGGSAPPAPGAFNLLSPSNAATGQTVAGTLSWQSSLNATGYDVYLDGTNPPSTIVSSNQAGTSYAYSGLASGATYYWKVVAKNSAGSVTATGAPWNFTTAAAAQVLPTVTTNAAASILSSSALINGSVNPNGASTSAWFEWGSSSTLSSYTITSTQAIGSGTLPTAISTSISGLAASTTYYFRAAAQNGAGIQRGSILSFTTLPVAPPTPTLFSPANASVGQPTSVTVSWNASLGAATYRLQVSTSSTFSTLVLDDATLTTTTRVVSGLATSTTYFWQVSATNIAGTSPYSTVWSFTTAAGSSMPTATTTAATSVLTTSAVSNGNVNPNGAATSAWIEWSTSSAFTSYNGTSSQAIGSGTSAVAISATLSGLASSTVYYFRAAGQNASGTQRGTIMSFTTTSSGTMPTVATAAAGSILASSAISNGTVNPNGNATTSWFEYGTSSTLSSYSSTTAQSSGSGTTAVAVTSNLTGLAASTTYYFRAVGQNGLGTQRGNIMSFVTLPTAPLAPALSAPGDGATAQATALTVTWNASSGATLYHVQVSTSSTFTSLFVDDATLTTTSRSVSGLANSTVYYWRVNASNSGGTSAYSGVFSFTTTTAPVQPPPAPVLVSPVNYASKLSTTPTVSWNASAGAASYHLQVSTSSSFSTFVADIPNLTTTSVALTLGGGTTYYWRVSAANSGGTSAWSAAWSFKTVNGGGPKGQASIAYDPNSASTIAPQSYELNQNYPNPFNPTTTISFSLPANSVVTLKVMNLIGQEVATLIDNQTMSAGTQLARFDAGRLASGIYIYRIDATSVSDPGSKFTQIRKMSLLK